MHSKYSNMQTNQGTGVKADLFPDFRILAAR